MSIRKLPKELQAKANDELNEVPSRISEDLIHIKEWIKKQPHLNARIDDQWLICFLRGCKFSLQKTKEKLDLYYSTRTMLPEYFTNRDPFAAEVHEFFKSNVLVELPETSDPLEPIRYLIVTKDCHPQKIPIRMAFKIFLMLVDITLYENDKHVINGQEAIVDLSGLPFNYIGQLTPSLAQTIMIVLQNSYPLRPRAVHILNYPELAEGVINMGLSFLSKKIRSRVYLHKTADSESMFKLIPRRVLPKEYGGCAGPIAELTNKYRLKLEEHHEWLLKDSIYRSDESKRLGRPRKELDIYSVEGSFRKLQID